MGVTRPAGPDAHLHMCILVGGREDRPGKSGQAYRLCTDFMDINCMTHVNGFPVPDLQNCIQRLEGVTCFQA